MTDYAAIARAARGRVQAVLSEADKVHRALAARAAAEALLA